jgi:putative nucleotidyltransferase with HDIG domain
MYEAVREIIDPLYLVGGAVRDELLGLAPKDYDFCTPLLPDDIEARVRAAGRRPYVSGKRFGTIGFKLDGQFVECTTFRTEKYTAASRKPAVAFCSNVTHDLSRRDFTVNALARRGRRIIDPFGGQEDLSQKMLRAVGTPSHRFREDPLRILRLARFRSQLGFDVDPLTFKKARELSYKVLSVSRERWMQEMDKLLVGEHVYQGLDLMADTRLLNYMLPELAPQVGYEQNNPHHDFTLWEHTLKVVQATPADVTMRWAALLHDIGKPYVRTDRPDRSNYVRHDLLGYEMVLKLAAYSKWSNDRRDVVSALVRDHLSVSSPLKPYDDGASKHQKGERGSSP